MSTSVTAFAIARHEGRWLMVRHRRLGVTAWEVPGGHVEVGETLEEAAARETFEETGLHVIVDGLAGTCVHEWPERRRRQLIAFFRAGVKSPGAPRAPRSEPDILYAGWVDPLTLAPEEVSAFLHPLVELERSGWRGAPIHYRMSHQLGTDGRWRPAAQA